MPDPHARYADWKAPAADGQTLLWPDARALVAQTRANHALLGGASHVRVQNVPLPELRRQMRRWVGHRDDGQLLIGTGHQTELYHPGVWAKHALVDAVAQATGGRAMFVAVDTDSPKHLSVRWPGWQAPVTDDPRVTSAEWSGLLDQPTPRHLNYLMHELDAARAGWRFEPLLGSVLESLRRLAVEPTASLSAALTNACHALDWELGLRHEAVLASPLLVTAPYLALVHHVCARADAFAADYNAALRAYRAAAGITNPGRPMPDLRSQADAVEVPFWLDTPSTGDRERATVLRVDGRWALVRADAAFAFDPATDGLAAAERLGAWLRQHDLRLAPRALTLTMFLRLLLVDQFAHGIGGGRYDQVLDALIARHFGLDPPRFSVATATLVSPAAAGRSRACLPCLKQEGHQLRHRVLGPAKMALVSAIAAAPRRSFERSRLFAELHTTLAEHVHHPSLADWARRLTDAHRLEQEQRTLFDRELFYAVQSRDRLQRVIADYRARFA